MDKLLPLARLTCPNPTCVKEQPIFDGFDCQISQGGCGYSATEEYRNGHRLSGHVRQQAMDRLGAIHAYLALGKATT